MVLNMELWVSRKRGPFKGGITFLGVLLVQWVIFSNLRWAGEAVCMPQDGCSMAVAHYIVAQGETLDSVGVYFQTTSDQIVAANSNLTNKNYVQAGQQIYVPFKCDCTNNQLQHKFFYQVSGADTVNNITSVLYQNLTTTSAIIEASSLSNANSISSGAYLQIPINCSCGDPTVSYDYGLFLTYVVAAGKAGNVSGIASDYNTTQELLKQYNPNVVWDNSQPNQIAFIPVTDKLNVYPPYSGNSGHSGNSMSIGAIVGGAVGGAVVLFAIVGLVLYYIYVYAPKRPKRGSENRKLSDHLGFSEARRSTNDKLLQSMSSTTSSNPGSASYTPEDYKVDKSVEFTYEELANCTNNFSMAHKIGEGGFATVYYGEIRGQRLAIKRMNLQASKEFMAELKILTNVHHTNLVQLIGYCTTDYFFLVYEFVENGTLEQHLHSSKGKAPLSWPSRVQIALDAARGLEYIHEHTKPTYIHRDIKPANILIDKQLHAKVADFGLTKLTDSGGNGQSTSLPTRVVGTWGYMPLEYARFGDVSPMMDVYSFGVILFELVSGKPAIVQEFSSKDMGASMTTNTTTAHQKVEPRALVTIFDPILKDPNGKASLPELVDPVLEDNYPIDSVWKMVQLAGECTNEDSKQRPTMRKAVVSLMTLSSSTQEWEVTSLAPDGGIFPGR